MAQALRFMSMLLILTALVALDGCASQRANQKAAALTWEAVQPRLERIATDHPAQAATVQAIVNAQPAAAEADIYRAAEPLLRQQALEYPNEAEAIEALLSSWRQRLERFGAVLSPPQ